jgi:beta-barrel assembly-enhancing protease
MTHFKSHRLRKGLTGLAISSAVALGVSVGTPAAAQVPLFDLLFRGIQVIQLSNVSGRQEVQLGQQMNQQLLRQGMRVSQDAQLNRYVNQVGQRLAAKSGYTSIPYTFQVVNDPRVNAFATTGGYVYVTTGLMKAADNEAQLASVLAHEIGHISSRHLIEQMRQAAITRGLASAAGLNRSTAVNLGLELAVNRPRSRADEFEADRASVRMMREAGYAESASVAFMRKLLNQRSTPTFLSTHPAVGDRVGALERSIRSGPGNECTQSPTLAACGLSNASYGQQVKSRL